MTIQWHNGYQPGRQRVEELIGRKLDWGDAGERKWKEHGGCLVVGTDGMLRATEHNSRIFLYPESRFADFDGPPRILPRSGSHEREWIAACKVGPKAMSNFDYAGPLVELLMLGNIATQFPDVLEFDRSLLQDCQPPGSQRRPAPRVSGRMESVNVCLVAYCRCEVSLRHGRYDLDGYVAGERRGGQS